MQLVYLGGLHRPARIQHHLQPWLALNFCVPRLQVLFGTRTQAVAEMLREGSLWAERLVRGQVRVTITPSSLATRSVPMCQLSRVLPKPPGPPGQSWRVGRGSGAGGRWMLGVPSQGCSCSISRTSSSPLSQQKAVSPCPSWHVTRAWAGLSHLLQAE